jgi:hypothetical protein
MRNELIAPALTAAQILNLQYHRFSTCRPFPGPLEICDTAGYQPALRDTKGAV